VEVLPSWEWVDAVVFDTRSPVELL
jgi:hypothetical protein